MDNKLQREFEYYLAHQEELLKRYNGRFIVLKNQQVLGDYASDLDAVLETQKTHEMGTFLVQRVVPGDDGYTQTFRSRVAFAN